MAVALTDFEAMCGFRSLPDILHHLASYPELAAIVGKAAISSQDSDSADHLKKIFSSFMRAPQEQVAQQLEALVRRLASSHPSEGSVDALILRLNEDFPGDRGALCPLILNYINLKPG